jgi:hypothetical protein
VPEETAARLREAAETARYGAGEALRERERERERARLHEETMKQGRTRLGEVFREAGLAPEDAERLCAPVLERVRAQSRVRAELLSRVCMEARAGGEAEAAELAAEASLCAEAGASEEDAAKIAGLALRFTRVHKERVRIVREARLASTASGEEVGPVAARLAASLETALQKRLSGGSALDLMRQVRRCLADGVPSRVVLDVLDKELREMKAVGPDLDGAVAEGLRAVERIRETLRKQAEEHRDRFGANRDRSPGRPGGTGKGPG